VQGAYLLRKLGPHMGPWLDKQRVEVGTSPGFIHSFILHLLHITWLALPAAHWLQQTAYSACVLWELRAACDVYLQGVPLHHMKAALVVDVTPCARDRLEGGLPQCVCRNVLSCYQETHAATAA
jgi:hypothetical protein